MAPCEPWTSEPDGPEFAHLLVEAQPELPWFGYVDRELIGYLGGNIDEWEPRIIPQWTIVAVLSSEIRPAPKGTVKAPRGWVRFSGSEFECLTFMAIHCRLTGREGPFVYNVILGVSRPFYDGDEWRLHQYALAQDDHAHRAAESFLGISDVGSAQRPRKENGAPVLPPWDAEPCGPEFTYMLRRNAVHYRGVNGLQWPTEGYVAADNWSQGFGLHGLLDGLGAMGAAPDIIQYQDRAGYVLDSYRSTFGAGAERFDPLGPDYVWLVVAVHVDEVEQLPNSGSFEAHAPRGWVKYHGDLIGALACMAEHAKSTGRNRSFVNNALSSCADAYVPAGERFAWISAQRALIQERINAR